MALLLSIMALSACRTKPLPKVNLSAPAWTVVRGQAVWRTQNKRPEIAGELLVATTTNGERMIQFTKMPFPLAIAQTTSNSWQLEYPTEQRTFRASGHPPSRVIWFQLGRAVSGQTLQKPWQWTNSPPNWRIENRSTGESLEGYFEEPAK